MRVEFRIERIAAKRRYRVGVYDPRTRMWRWRFLGARRKQDAETEAPQVVRSILREFARESERLAAELLDDAKELRDTARVWEPPAKDAADEDETPNTPSQES